MAAVTNPKDCPTSLTRKGVGKINRKLASVNPIQKLDVEPSLIFISPRFSMTDEISIDCCHPELVSGSQFRFGFLKTPVVGVLFYI